MKKIIACILAAISIFCICYTLHYTLNHVDMTTPRIFLNNWVIVTIGAVSAIVAKILIQKNV